MTNQTYNKLWASAQENLAYLIRKESPGVAFRIARERLVAIRRTARLYLKYIQVTNQLIECYENIVQPQKRRFLQKLVDACIGRVLELKHEMVDLEFSEFHYLDQILLELKITPNDMNIKIPSYILEEKSDEERQHKQIIKYYLNLNSPEVEIKKMTVKEAIHLIQIHERARQGRCKFFDSQKNYEIKKRNKYKEAKPKKTTKYKFSRNDAAVIIQKAWRSYIIHKKKKDEMKKLKKIPSFNTENEKINAFQLIEELKKEQLKIRQRNEAEYQEAVLEVKNYVKTYCVPDMVEELQDKIRAYFHKYREKYGEFPVFPSEEEGGSTLMLEQGDLGKENVENELELKVINNDASQIANNVDELGEDVSSEEDEIFSDDEDLQENVADDEEGSTSFYLKASKYIPDLVLLNDEYNRVWSNRKPVDLFDKHDRKMIEEQVLKEMEINVRIHVDQIMRDELLRLNEAFEKDFGKKTKKEGKKGGKKSGKKDRGKDNIKDKSKAKKEKDLTPHRTFESLVQELVEQNIIIDYPKFKLSEFIGDYNYIGSIIQMDGDPEQDPLPCLGDVRRVVNEYCILPMGSSNIHAKGPYVPSILFAGPHGIGKKSLVYAICNEIGATLMDLSAENIDGKYPGKEGLDMLMHLIAKVGRLAQPTIIYIKDAENYFWKKKPPSCTIADPGRLKKVLPKFVKDITGDERILICGTTVLPFDVDLKGLDACYSKIICIFKPDYNCRRALWREMILKYKGVLTPELDLTTLCNVSDGFTAPHIEDSVKQVINDRRIFFMQKVPLYVAEFTPFLASHVPIYEEEEEAYKAWLMKMPLQKKRIKMLEEAMEEPEEEDSGEESQ